MEAGGGGCRNARNMCETYTGSCQNLWTKYDACYAYCIDVSSSCSLLSVLGTYIISLIYVSLLVISSWLPSLLTRS